MSSAAHVCGSVGGRRQSMLPSPSHITHHPAGAAATGPVGRGDERSEPNDKSGPGSNETPPLTACERRSDGPPPAPDGTVTFVTCRAVTM